MAQARSEANWDHTSLIASVIANAAPFRKGRTFKPEDFRPRVREPMALKGRAMVDELRAFLKQ